MQLTLCAKRERDREGEYDMLSFLILRFTEETFCLCYPGLTWH